MVNSPSQTDNSYVVALGLPWPPPKSGDDADSKKSRELPDAVWKLDDFHNCARRYTNGDKVAIIAVNRDVINDMQRDKLEYKDVAEIVLMLTEDHRRGSFWCEANTRVGVKVSADSRWYPCDAFCIEVENFYDDYPSEYKKYYLKMSRTLNGRTMLMISTHESNFC